MDAGRRHETPESESKDVFIHNITNSMNISIFLSGSLASKSHEKTRDGVGWIPAQAVGFITREKP